MRATGKTLGAIVHVVEGWKSKTFAHAGRVAAWKEHDDKLHAFLKASIPEALAHTGEATFDEHLIGVQSVLRTFGADEVVCTAGLFHSLYGTEGFQGFKFPILRRHEIRQLIGTRAENLVWLFCVVDRKVFDDAVFKHGENGRDVRLLSRPELGRFPLELSTDGEWLDFIELVLADWMDQVEGAAEKDNLLFEWRKGEAWSYRRHAYMRMADVLYGARSNGRGEIIKQIVEEIYSREPASTRHIVQVTTPPMSDAAREARDAIKSISL